MGAFTEARRATLAGALGPGLVALGMSVSACHREGAPKLEKVAVDDVPIPDVPVPDEKGPRLGAIAHVVPVVERPSRKGAVLGVLHAGATVARSPEPVSKVGCDGGWYAVRPRGFVCAGPAATLDPKHPTLTAMAMRPDPAADMPYTYARAVRDTTIYEVDPDRDRGVRPAAKLRAKSGFAVVGSWTAQDPAGERVELAMGTDGHFVPTAHLEALRPSSFRGVVLGEDRKLPLAFVVKRGVRAWKVKGIEAEKDEQLGYHEELALTGKTRRLGSTEFWATEDGRTVRLEDVTIVRERHEMPAFAKGDQRWLDVSVVTGVLVAYEGAKPVFATLVSVGRDRLGAPAATLAPETTPAALAMVPAAAGAGEPPAAVTRRGEFPIAKKSLTALERDATSFTEGIATYDVPWALELASGQSIVGAYWHDRFGIERSQGDIELSPADAAWVFRWATPSVPDGWHAVAAREADPRVIVNVRK